MAKPLRHLILLAACLCAASAGLGSGYGAHMALSRSFLSGGRAYVLAAVPSASVMNAVRGIQSDDPAERAASWYEIARLKLSDSKLMKEAYDAEPVPFVRSSILYAMREIDRAYWEQFVSQLPADRKPPMPKDRRTIQSFRL